MKLSFFSVLLLAGHLCVAAPMPLPESNDGASHVFSTNQENFLMDGKPIKIISGEMHYPRVPRQHWKDRFQRIKAMGMNTVCTYLFWNVHEPEPGKWDFSGNLDFVEFIKEAQKAGLWVIVRPGPYVCAEWEFGGFPGWLLKDEDLKVRSQDPRFLEPAMAYLKKVCSMLEPLQITKGGPIIMAQVENEYGSYGSDKDYVKKHLDVIRKELPGVVPFTSDGPNDWMIKNGTLPGVVPAMNFGGGAKGAFANLEKHKGKTPRINGEFWVGWFDHWGKPKNGGSTEGFNRDLKWMLENNVSPNLFMVHGGTSFGFMNGANWEGAYTPDVTNYDYGAPISENGTLTDRYRTFRQTIQDYYGDTYKLPEPPAQPEMMELPPITFTETAGMFSRLPQPSIRKEPVHMEALGQSLGFILYRTKVQGPVKGELKMNNMQDRAIVYVDGKRQGAADRRYKQDSCDIVIPSGLHTVDIFVENMGRINFGGQIQGERKGIRGPITLDGKKLENFLIYNFPCKGVELIPFSSKKPAGDQPVFHRGYFNVSNPKDTYLDMRDGWKKGVVWVNGRNLGRFWFIGSQQALYCPGEYLKPGKNEIVVLDVDGGSGTVKGVKEAIYEVNRDPAMADVFRVGKPVAPAAGQLVHKGSFAKGADQQEIKFRAPVQARYIAIVSKNAHDNGPHAAIAELNFLDASGNLLPREQWSVVYADSHETTGEAAQAGLVMDNQPTTYWHTKWQGDNPRHPHMIVLDLGKVQKLSGFRYLPRQDRENGRIKDYEVYASPKPFKPAK
ncbi:beta-galactosidase [uncultured Akkermansia sp.]|uniref:beta-galactosidase n=1 Tax=uncultured Akkermansia sp. TaxID=512294 RepID=UPI0026257B45|nr:beta-galactosidase [uncultured Akkermansia sp.]